MRSIALLILVVSTACVSETPPVEDDRCFLAEFYGGACTSDSECTRDAGRCENGCCVALPPDCGRRQDCSPPICIDTLPVPNDAAFLPTATLCDGGVCIIDDGVGGCFESAPPPASCVVVNGGVALSGRAIRMEALALDERGAPASYPPTPVWSFEGAELTAQCDGPDICVVDVTAQMVPVSCTGSVRVYPPVDGSRAVVVDQRFRPLADVRVDFVVDGAHITRTTNADGVAIVDGSARLVSAMPDEHEWHTIIEPPRDVVLVARTLRAPTVRTGTVDFGSVHTQGDIKVALTGFAIPSLADMTLDAFFGEPVPTNVELEGITDPGGQLVPLPSSLVLMLGDNPIRGEWSAFGDNELTWSIGLQVPLAEVGPIISGAVEGIGPVLPGLLPFFARADHFVGLRDDVVAPSMLSLATRELVLGEHDAPHVLATAFARVPGRGILPLGFGALPDDDESPVLSNIVTAEFAPPHDGLEGSEVFFTATALDIDALETTPVQLARASLGDSVAIAMPAFVPLVDAAFDGDTFTTTNDPGADLYRVRFDGWTVWSTTPPSFALTDVLVDNTPPLRSNSVRVDALVTSRALDFATLQELDAVMTSMSSRPLQ